MKGIWDGLKDICTELVFFTKTSKTWWCVPADSSRLDGRPFHGHNCNSTEPFTWLLASKPKESRCLHQVVSYVHLIIRKIIGMTHHHLLNCRGVDTWIAEVGEGNIYRTSSYFGDKTNVFVFFQTIHLLDDSWSAPTFPIKNHGEIWDIQSIINYPINQSINQSVSIILSQSPSISIGSSSRFPSEKPPHFFVRNVHHEAIAGQGQSAGRNLCSAGWWEGGGFLTWRFHRFTHKNKGPVMGNFIG